MELVEAFPRQHLETNVTLQFEEQMGRYILILHFENTGAFISAFFVGLELLDDFEPIWNQDFPGPGAYGRPLVSGERDAIPAVLTDDLMGRIDSLRYVATWSTDRIRDKKSFGGLVKNMRGYRSNGTGFISESSSEGGVQTLDGTSGVHYSLSHYSSYVN